VSADLSTESLKYEVKNRVAWVTLDTPEAMNALSTALLGDVQRAFDEIAKDDDVFAVVMIGSGGRAFSAGADLKEMAALQAAQVASGGKRTPAPNPTSIPQVHQTRMWPIRRSDRLRENRER
jgi:enoyl-CoA hydratase/carnithine racemase